MCGSLTYSGCINLQEQIAAFTNVNCGGDRVGRHITPQPLNCSTSQRSLRFVVNRGGPDHSTSMVPAHYCHSPGFAVGREHDFAAAHDLATLFLPEIQGVI